MTSPEDDQTEFEVALPFVTVKSNGGPHDDESFAAGFEMGALDVILGTPYLQIYSTEIHSTSVRQADLIAMHYDFKMTMDSEDGTRASVTFSRVCTCNDPC